MGVLLDRVIAYTHNERNEINERTPAPPGEQHQPLRADHEFAELLGVEGCRQQFLGAVDLVAHLSGDPWAEQAALRALSVWWGRDIEDLTPVEWIISAAFADEVRGDRA